MSNRYQIRGHLLHMSPSGGVDSAVLCAGVLALVPPELPVERRRRDDGEGQRQALLRQRAESVHRSAVRGAPAGGDDGGV